MCGDGSIKYIESKPYVVIGKLKPFYDLVETLPSDVREMIMLNEVRGSFELRGEKKRFPEVIRNLTSKLDSKRTQIKGIVY